MVTLTKARPCSDCGGRFPAVCMDYDHLPGSVKLASVGALSSGYRWREAFAEIDKCELVCSNCHRVRTQERHAADA